MSQTRMMMTRIAKALVVQFAVLLVSAAVFGLFCIFVFQTAFSIQGCSMVLAVGLLLWSWACWRSDEPATRTFRTLLLHSVIVFLFFLGVSILRFVFEDSARIAVWHLIVLLATVALFWHLRGIAIRRNKQTERLGSERDAA